MADKLKVHLADDKNLTVCGAHKYAMSVWLESGKLKANCGNCFRKVSIYKVKPIKGKGENGN